MIDGSVVLTGADQPLGATLAETLASETDVLVLGGADGDALEATAEAIDGRADVLPVRTDVRDEFDVERLLELAARRGTDGLGLVIPCARVRHTNEGEPIAETAYAAFDDGVRTNLRGVFTTIREAIPHCGEESAIVVPIQRSATSTGMTAVTEAGIGRLVEETARSDDVTIVGVAVDEIDPSSDEPETETADLVATVVTELDLDVHAGTIVEGENLP